jgi:biopolymer transport protein ExbB
MAEQWYAQTPPLARVSWGGMVACGLLGAWVVLDRSLRVRRGRVMPSVFAARFLRRLEEGELDAGKALDYLELNPSSASRVALGAVRRWGRAEADLERGVRAAVRLESERMRQGIGTLKRVAAMAPLLGLLGTLGTLRHGLRQNAGLDMIEPLLADALGPLTVGISLAILALVVHDGLSGRIDRLVANLESAGLRVVEAIALSGGTDGRRGRSGRVDFESVAQGPHRENRVPEARREP